jgi:hypothetical protein
VRTRRSDRNALATPQLDQILETIDDFDRSIDGPDTNVARLEPAVISPLRFRLLWELKVPRSHTWTADPELSSTDAGHLLHPTDLLDDVLRVGSEVFVAGSIADTVDAHETEVDTPDGTPCDSIPDFVQILRCSRSRRFGQTIPTLRRTPV